MTFIIAGKLKESTFMMADSIATLEMNTEGIKKQIFRNKIVGLNSSPGTYFAIIGEGLISDSLRLYDEWCFLYWAIC